MGEQWGNGGAKPGKKFFVGLTQYLLKPLKTVEKTKCSKITFAALTATSGERGFTRIAELKNSC